LKTIAVFACSAIAASALVCVSAAPEVCRQYTIALLGFAAPVTAGLMVVLRAMNRLEAIFLRESQRAARALLLADEARREGRDAVAAAVKALTEDRQNGKNA
jgi:uncharacterized SAM-binding protein YcdF (DUF218 family)